MNPLTGIYGAASSLRNKLFDRGTLRSHRLQKPVVSVGNLSVGGAGKTPFVITLGELLKARGIRFDVLSRGYGRKTRGVLVVDPNGSAVDFGDEPLLISRKLGIPVVVGESRYDAGRLAEQKFDSQLHILDDGFQHRSLARDFDIVLLTKSDFKDQLLPSGRLREPLSALARADVVVVPSGASFGNSDIQYKPYCEVKRSVAVPDPPDTPVVFCGIARPDQFFVQVRSTGIQPAAEIVFRDHHSYRSSDIERLQATRQKTGAGGFVTTEKDAINLGSLRSELAPLAIANLVLAIFSPADILDSIFQKLALDSLPNPA
jgi:tetraacyldisaccharide 4'-kinase